MPNKPHKSGVKLFVLCDSHGYSYRFEIFNGAGNNVVVPGAPDLGATANVVVRLSQTIPDFVHHIVYFDNFYTTLPLLVYLRARGIYSLGTVRANRLPNCKLPSDKDPEMTKAARGYSTEYAATAYGIDLSTVLWKDTRCVRLASTYVGITPFSRSTGVPEIAKISRYNRQEKKYVNVDCPQIIREYNAHMGGVDLMDGLMGRYKITLKTRDVMTRIFYHLVDMTITNAYILYKRANFEKQKDPSQPKTEEHLLSLPEFRLDLAAALCAYTKKRPVGRPSTAPEELEQPSVSGQRARSATG
ncbi:piggyBac transposable element-derived protein 1-like [Rhagoletis pomonella]|uniref:piggyBac transposable element-derived protein 1-like n=1 Tax=Rhagoletis pomonella TaxID=28610 RepID=UPI00177AF213|nr:piggyBac transposable element-derived protein 1-like [Rhagoletis pomonella]